MNRASSTGFRVQDNPFSSFLSSVHFSLFRPRFVYLTAWFWLSGFPIPFVLLLPLSLVQLGIWIASRALENKTDRDAQSSKAIDIILMVRSQIGQLRLMPAVNLVEITVKGKLLAEAQIGKYSLEKINFKVGLW